MLCVSNGSNVIYVGKDNDHAKSILCSIVGQKDRVKCLETACEGRSLQQLWGRFSGSDK